MRAPNGLCQDKKTSNTCKDIIKKLQRHGAPVTWGKQKLSTPLAPGLHKQEVTEAEQVTKLRMPMT